MKKITAVFLGVCLLLFGAACNGGQSGGSENISGDSVGEKNGKILIVYFSWSENTKDVAEAIAENTGGDLAEIIAETPYSTNYDETLQRARQEGNADARPAISAATTAELHIVDYAAVFIGYPIWHGGEPMIIRSFFEEYLDELSDKNIYLFSTSASSGGNAAQNSLKALYPQTKIKDCLHLTNSMLVGAADRVGDWLQSLDLPVPTAQESVENVKIKMLFASEEITVTPVDNSAGRDLVKRLRGGAMTLSFSDFGGAEKIAYPSPALDVSDATGCDPAAGDLTIYKPWGNLAAFYRNSSGFSSDLVLVGRIEGIERIAAQKGDFQAVLYLATEK